MRGAAAATAAALAGVWIQGGAQEPSPPPRFAATAEVVRVTVVVADESGRPITTLRREDFQIRADGRRQQVHFFRAPGDAALDLGLLIDTSGSMAPWQREVSQSAVRFLDEVPRAQVRLLVSFDTHVRFWNTGVPAADVVSQMRAAATPGGATGLRTAITAALDGVASAERAALVLLTDGEEWGSLVGERELFDAIESTNVTVYALRFPPSAATDRGQFLTRVVRETGGRLFESSRADATGIFAAIREDLASQYVLGFVPDTSLSGFHRLEVTTRTGARVRHRAGYRVATGPAPLERTWARIARQAKGQVGAAAVLVETGERFELSGDEPFPMQSVFKLPAAVHVLRHVDEGVLRLDRMVRLAPADFRRGHSPVRDRWPGGVVLSVEELLALMVAESDNTAADALLALAGGPAAVTARLRELGVAGVRVDRAEDELARDLLDGGEAALQRYLADGRDTATPNGAADLLVRLAGGASLAAPSHARLMRWLVETPTGARRLKALLPRGTVVAHKTGTGPTVSGVNACTNDIGLITLPDGRRIAIAVFVKGSRASDDARDGVIARIARAAYDHWAASGR